MQTNFLLYKAAVGKVRFLKQMPISLNNISRLEKPTDTVPGVAGQAVSFQHPKAGHLLWSALHARR